jgi:transcriptional regulator with XRE-family HTH domain
MSRQFGAKLRHLRLQRRLTQTELADQLQLASHAHVNNLEAGRRAPSLDLVLRVATIFAVTTDYLVRDTVPVDLVAARDPAVSSSSGQAGHPKRFGEKLRHLRKQRNLTQVELAAALQLRTQAHLSMLESTRTEPSIAMVLHLAEFFGVTVEYLVCDAIPIATDPSSG